MGGSGGHQAMAEFWEELPVELRDKIIAHIGAPEILALQLVSRHWSSLISCPRFLKFCAEIPRAEQWMLVPKWPLYTGFLAFLPGSERWTSIPFGLSQNLHVESSMHGESRSLLLLRTPEYSFPQRLHIYSPLLRGSKMIIRCQSGLNFIRGTAVLIHDHQRLGGDRDRAEFRFRIVAVVGGDSQQARKEVGISSPFYGTSSALQAIVYDSSSGSWSRGGRLPRDVLINGSQKRQSVLVESRSHGVLMLVLGERDEREELLVYQIQKRKWEQIQLPVSGLQTKNWVIHCEGAALVFLVQVDPLQRTLTLWRLPVEDLVRSSGSEKKKSKWVCEAGAGREIDEKFVDDEKPGAVDCIGLRDRIIVCKFPNYLSYQLESKSWAPLPAPPEKADCLSRAFVFCPKLM